DEAMLDERARTEEAFGLPFPGMGIWVSPSLHVNECELLLLEVPAGRLDLPPGKVAIEASGAPPGSLEIANMPGLYWVNPDGLSAAVKIITLERMMAMYVMAELTKQAHLFLGIQETQWILDKLNADYPGLVTEVQKVLPLQRISDVLRRLLEEQVSIRSMRNILESLVYWGPKEKDVLVLTEYVRGDLGRLIAFHAAGGAQQLPAIFLDVLVEQQIRQAIKPTPTGNFLTLGEEEIALLVGRIETMATGRGSNIAVVTSMDIRRYVRKMLQPRMPWLRVYSFQELGSHLELVPIGQISNDDIG
ncbi:MAG: EscV/YscV/HrcV family type III secretion system export apparatus protein, partial [Alcaligenaceae bacterium]